MEDKKFAKLNDQELENVSGGNKTATNYGPASQWGDDVNFFLTKACPKCNNKHGMQGTRFPWKTTVDGKAREIIGCNGCGHCFYINDDGDLIYLGYAVC